MEPKIAEDPREGECVVGEFEPVPSGGEDKPVGEDSVDDKRDLDGVVSGFRAKDEEKRRNVSVPGGELPGVSVVG